MRLDTKYGNGCSYDETLAPEDTDQKQWLQYYVKSQCVT